MLLPVTTMVWGTSGGVCQISPLLKIIKGFSSSIFIIFCYDKSYSFSLHSHITNVYSVYHGQDMIFSALWGHLI